VKKYCKWTTNRTGLGTSMEQAKFLAVTCEVQAIND